MMRYTRPIFKLYEYFRLIYFIHERLNDKTLHRYYESSSSFTIKAFCYYFVPYQVNSDDLILYAT